MATYWHSAVGILQIVKLKKQKSAIFGRGGLQRMANVLNFMFFLNLFSILPFPGIDRGKET